MKSWLAGFTALVLLLSPMAGFAQQSSISSAQNPPQDDSAHLFLTSCTYGVLAGTLVGAASLAFTSNPGQSLQDVARGASLGLYAGILLGLYVIYVVPDLDDNTNSDEVPVGKLDRFPLMVAPVFNDRQARRASAAPAGVKADWTVLRF